MWLFQGHSNTPLTSNFDLGFYRVSREENAITMTIASDWIMLSILMIDMSFFYLFMKKLTMAYQINANNF